MPLSRLLFLAQPDAAVAHRAVELASLMRRHYRLAGQPFQSGRLHATLQHLGDYEDLPPVLVEAATRAAATISMPTFDVTFNRIETWPDAQALVLLGDERAAGLAALGRQLGLALRAMGLGRLAKMGITPHMTLLRGPGFVEEQMVSDFHWTVREFVLVNSLVGEGKYVPLGRWPLSGA